MPATFSTPIPIFDFGNALNEYRALRNFNQSKEITTAVEKNLNLNMSTIVIEDNTDDELEDGEIVDDEPKNDVEVLMKESLNAIQHSKVITMKHNNSTNQTGFYEDKNLDNLKVSKIPIYQNNLSNGNQTTTNNQSLNESHVNEVICLDNSTQQSSDDSVIFMSENRLLSTSPPLQLPRCLSESAIKDLYQKIPKTNKQNVKISPCRQKKIQRTREYMKRKKKQKKLEQENVSSQQPSTSTAPDFIIMPTIERTELTSSKASSISSNNNHIEKQSTSTASLSNIVLPSSSPLIQNSKEKRIILIDGSNVAFGFSGKTGSVDKNFSAEGLKIAIDTFTSMGFKVKAIVPEFRVRQGRSSNHDLMNKMKDSGEILLTPAKSYDDLMLMQSAQRLDAAIVSNDFFRDIRMEHKEYIDIINNRQIRFNWVFGQLLLVEDPYGRKGPKLNQILYK